MIFCFGVHELDEERFELRREGCAVAVQPKALELLLHLVRNRERVVAQQEMLRAVWPDAAVTPGSLARAVSLARAAIGDRGRAPQAIVTVPRRGYRFAAAVREAGGGAPGPRTGEDPTSRYVGRARLIERLEARLEGALAGSGCILFLAGEPGIGKTRTAELLAARAERAGATVAAAWGAEEGAPALASWTQVLRALAARVPDAAHGLLAEPRAVLARLLPELGAGGDEAGGAPRGEDTERFALASAVRAFLASAARRGPLLLCFDDLHGADAESIGLLELVGSVLAGARIAVVATCREEDAGRTPRQARAIERLLRLTALERWPLAPLSAEEVRELVRARLGREPDAALLGALERQTGGNPLLIGESLRSLEARGLLGQPRTPREWEALLPRGVRHLLLPKLRRLSAGAREVLAYAAAAGAEVDRDLLADCLPDASRLDAALDELLDAALLVPGAGEGARFAHALVREAIYRELLPAGERRRAAHARVAAALERRPGAPGDAIGERAHHACEAVPHAPAHRAVELARRAGEEAARRLDFEGAAAWSERALAALGFVEPADSGLRAALLLGLGDAQTRALGPERARASYREAAECARTAGRDDLLVAAALGLAHRPSSSGDGDAETIQLLEEARRRVPAGAEALRIRLLSRLAVELRYADRARAETLVAEASAAARRFGDSAVLAQTLDDSTFVRWGPADSRGWVALNAEVVEAARASGDLELVLAGERGKLTGLLELGDAPGAERERRACERTADALPTPQARWFRAALGAMRALLEGELGAAEERVGEALALAGRVDAREVALEAGIQLAYLRLEQGRAAEIEPAVRAEVQRFPETAAWRAGLALVLAAAGREAEARSELEHVARQGFAAVPRDRGWLPALAFCAEVACACRAARVAAWLEPLLAPHARQHVVVGSGLLYYGAVAHALGLAAAAGSRWDAAIAHLEAALAAEEKMGARLWAARTRIACARALHARRGALDGPRAVKLVGEALAAARRHGWLGLVAGAADLEGPLRMHRVGPHAPPARGRRGRPSTS